MGTSSFRAKILWAASFGAIVLIVVVSIVYHNNDKVTDAQSAMIASQEKVAKLNSLANHIVDLETGERGFLLSGDVAYLEPFSEAESRINGFMDELEVWLKVRKKDVRFLVHLRELKQKWIDEAATNEMLARRKLNAGKITFPEFVDSFKSSNGKQIMDQLRREINGVADAELLEQKQMQAAILSASFSTRVSIVVGLPLSIFSMLVLLWIVTRNTSRQVIENVDGLSDASDNLELAAQSLVEHVSTLATSASQSAEAAHQSSQAMTEMETLVVRSSNESKECQASVLKMLRSSDNGRNTMEELALTISTIEGSNSQLGGILDVFERVRARTAQVSDIATKSTFLSFNAAIEAARAGKQGRGFSVVAEEIGSLATTSAKLATEIETMMKESRLQIESIIRALQANTNSTLQVTRDAIETFQTITVEIQQVSGKVTNIAVAGSAQIIEIKEAVRGVHEIASLTGKSDRAAGELLALASTIQSQAESLNEVVDRTGTLMAGSRKAG